MRCAVLLGLVALTACAAPAKNAPPAAPSLKVGHGAGGPACADAAEATSVAEMVRILNGDAVVLKYSVDFGDHADVAKRALALGAVAAEPQVVYNAEVGVRGPVRVLRGLTRSTRAKLTPRVVAGSLDGLAQGGVAMSTAMAHELAVQVGSEVTIWIEPQDGQTAGVPFTLEGDGPAAIKKTRRVSALLDFGPHDYTGYAQTLVFADLDDSRKLAELLDTNTTAVAVWAPPGTSEAPLVDALGTSLGQAYKVLPHSELDGPLEETVAKLRAECTH